jgi:predicted Zn-dependent protease
VRSFLLALCVGTILSLAAVGDTKTAVLPAPVPPPYAGAYQPHGVDEIGMWKEADENERTLANSPLVISDPELNTYIKNVLCETVGADRCKATRVYILRTPMFNASMTPNGTMRVYSGLLLRVRDEAELGSVLGHEFGHYERRHTLEYFKAARRGSDLMGWATVLASMSRTYGTPSSFNDLQLSVYGGLAHYGRNNEREADLLGIGYLNRSSLPPQSASKVWRNVMAEAEASASARGLSKPRFDNVAFFASHPPDAERATYLSALAAPEGATRDTGAARYSKALAPWLPQFLDDQIKLNDFGASEYVITSLAETGWTAPLWLARGDLYRMRGNQRDLSNAAEFYSNAVALNPTLAEAQRGLGLALIKTGQRDVGRAALVHYLALKPSATDAALISMLISKGIQ